jgi:dTDP-glucose 4,6-dehydratase
MRKILITGAAGFIGSHVVRQFLKQHGVVVLDKLTYAGHQANLRDVEDHPHYAFCQGDICDQELVRSLFASHDFAGVVHLAAESHVDRSIDSPLQFIQTNVMGTGVLLQAALEYWRSDFSGRCFYHVSTDEVYGSLGDTGEFTEETPYSPRSPYSASKAGSDHLVRAFHETYGLPVKISNCSNNYGPYQYPEKLIPVCIQQIVQNKPIPVYGQGINVRDWLYVEDHAEAIDLIYQRGRVGETYNVGGGCQLQNIQLVKLLCRLADEALGRAPGASENLISFVTDRLGHDHRYAVDFSKLTRELGWRPRMTLEEGLRKTLNWYLANEQWAHEVLGAARSASA